MPGSVAGDFASDTADGSGKGPNSERLIRGVSLDYTLAVEPGVPDRSVVVPAAGGPPGVCRTEEWPSYLRCLLRRLRRRAALRFRFRVSLGFS